MDLSGYAGAVGDPIVGQASDDFDVVGVRVALTQADGSAIEEGDAAETPPKSGRWVYTATAAVPPGTTVRIAVHRTLRSDGGGWFGYAPLAGLPLAPLPSLRSGQAGQAP